MPPDARPDRLPWCIVGMIAPTEATAAAISKVAALVEEYKLVASQFKGKKKEEPAPEPNGNASVS